MLNKAFILSRIEPYLNSKRELSEFEFKELFACGEYPLSKAEQYRVIDIMIAHGIEYVDEKEEETAALEVAGVLQQTISQADVAQLMGMGNEQLCVLAKDGDEKAMAALIEKNKRFVYQLAIKLLAQFSETNLTVEDLVSEGIIGLMKAVKRFDPLQDYKFTTYSWFWIRQNVTRSAIDTGYAIRLPVHIYEKMVRVQRYRKEHQDANLDELVATIQADDPSLNRQSICNLIRIGDSYTSTTSLNALVGASQETELQALLPDDNEITAERLMEDDSLLQTMENVLQTLKPREAEILRLRFGLEDGRSHTLEECGKKYNLTRERIRQIEAKALRKLRHPSRSKQLWEYAKDLD